MLLVGYLVTVPLGVFLRMVTVAPVIASDGEGVALCDATSCEDETVFDDERVLKEAVASTVGVAADLDSVDEADDDQLGVTVVVADFTNDNEGSDSDRDDEGVHDCDASSIVNVFVSEAEGAEVPVRRVALEDKLGVVDAVGVLDNSRVCEPSLALPLRDAERIEESVLDAVTVIASVLVATLRLHVWENDDVRHVNDHT